ncbi:uncharacterized protein LOC111710224 [Eurytemora carolleeae]|uniref:uncharacterized protein LOC111710224 n=1 Tax=Eurytemora carolleeae TaxID=1294199 RepID=UPI000C77E184|nr:uncharacterized protein LOC111710224 [Eurytemora carolleeae]|eukprot:XP_023340054.1 uncharacterized protein LOC111710224 [Eurytemora affinis]
MLNLSYISFTISCFLFSAENSAANPHRLGACKPTNGVENILRHMSAESVRKRVDCAVGIGRCDSIGKKLKEEGPKALQAAKCGNNCTCEEKRLRRLVNMMKRKHPEQWRRIEEYFNL